MKNNPDSALILLNEIEEPEALDNDIFAKWCLLYGNVKLQELSTKQIERALEWYMRHGVIKEKAQILLYLGKSLADQDEYDQAISHYINAYEIAQEHNLYDIAGNASCYMGDLYEQKNLVDKAIQKYRIAAEHFKAANNTKGYVCSLRDLGRDYALSDSLSAALQVTLHADSITSVLNNKNVHSISKELIAVQDGAETRSVAYPNPSIGALWKEVKPVIQTCWNQNSPYNNALDPTSYEEFQGYPYYDKNPVGCTGVAIAQIVAHFEVLSSAYGVNLIWSQLKASPTISRYNAPLA